MADDPAPQDALALSAPEGAALALREALGHARAFADTARSERTRDAYRYQWARFEVWCEAHALVPLPASPGTVALYLSAWASEGVAVATLAQALAAIGEAHRVSGHAPLRNAPELREVWKGIRRTLGTAPRRVAPLVVAELRELGRVLAQDTRIGRRDRALLMVGFAAALRRSELVALDVPDLGFTADGLELWLGRSKTDQEGEGARVGVPFRIGSRDLPRAGAARVARGRRARGRRGLPIGEPSRAPRGPALGPRRRAHRAAHRAPGRARSGALRGAFAPRRPRDERGQGGQARPGDHEARPVALARDGRSVRARRDPLDDENAAAGTGL